MVGITETFVLSGTKGMSVKVTVAENYDILSNTSDIAVTAEVISSVYSGHIYYLDGAVTAAEQTLRTMSSFSGTHFVYVQQTNTPYPIARGGGDTVDTPWELPNVVHEIDGSKTITVSIQLTGEEANGIGADGWTVTGSREVTLTHIPRASTVAATNAAVGAVSMVAVSRKSSTYTHSIHYRFGNLTGYLSPHGLSATEVRFADTSIAFAIPENFYTQIPKAKSGSCQLTCRTYAGGNTVGEPTVGSFTVTTEEATCKPLLAGTVEDVNPATLALTADANTLVRYASAAKCTIAAQPRNSAAITEKTIAGNVLTGDSLTINAVEGNTVVFTATDSRGYRTELAVTKKWIPYIHLTCHAEGKRTDPTSGNATLVISGDYFAGSFGAQGNSLTLRYRIDGGSWTGVTPEVKDNKYTAQAALTGLTYTNAYTLEVQATDKLQTVSKTLVIGKGIPVFDWGEKDFSFHVPVYLNAGMFNADGSLPFASVGKTVKGALGTHGWYRIGILSAENMGGFTATARLSIGGWFNDQNALPALVDIAFDYTGGYFSKTFDDLGATHFSRVRLCRIDNSAVAVDVYYAGTGINYTYVTVHEIQGVFTENGSYVNVSANAELVVATLDLNRVQNTRMDLIWVNAAPGTEFPAQTVWLDLSGYDCVEVIACVGAFPGAFITSAKIPIGQTGFICGFGQDFFLHERQFTVDSGSISFTSGFMRDTSDGTVYANWDGRSMPYKIYGIKEGQ